MLDNIQKGTCAEKVWHQVCKNIFINTVLHNTIKCESDYDSWKMSSDIVWRIICTLVENCTKYAIMNNNCTTNTIAEELFKGVADTNFLQIFNEEELEKLLKSISDVEEI